MISEIYQKSVILKFNFIKDCYILFIKKLKNIVKNIK